MVLFDKLFETLSSFKRDPEDHLKRVKKSKAVLILSVNGKPAFVVQDAHSYEQLLTRLQELETLEALRRSHADFEAGRYRPMREALADLEQEIKQPAQP